jgi:hypothetical protein
MKVFGDTVHFIALLSTSDRWHARAVAINRQSPGPLVTTEWVLTEVGDAFSHPAARQKFIRLLQLLVKTRESGGGERGLLRLHFPASPLLLGAASAKTFLSEPPRKR